MPGTVKHRILENSYTQEHRDLEQAKAIKELAPIQACDGVEEVPGSSLPPA